MENRYLENLSPFIAHRFKPVGISGDNHVFGNCPFCGRENHLYINIQSLAWDCKICGQSGALKKYLGEMSAIYEKEATDEILDVLAKNRGLTIETLRRWHTGFDGKRFTIPVYDLDRDYPTDIRTYQLGEHCLTTRGCKVSMLWNGVDGDDVYICEGEWDAMAFDEANHRVFKPVPVFGACGANVFPISMVPAFSGKNVAALYDNDTGGVRGMMLVQKRLQGMARSIRCIKWPPETPLKYDIRDLYQSMRDDPAQFLKYVEALTMLEVGETALGRKQKTTTVPAEAIPPSKDIVDAGITREQVVSRFQQTLYLPDPICLDIIFGTIFSVRLPGKPVWLFLVSPPGGGKSTISMTLIKSAYVKLVSTFNPKALVSGMNVPTGDPSLIPKLNGKVLIIKDFTTILSMSHQERDQVLGILRDASDGYVYRPYANKVVREYHSIFGIIAGVTPAIELFTTNHATLGERFLRFHLHRHRTVASDAQMAFRAVQNIGREPETDFDTLKLVQDMLDRPLKQEDCPVVPESIQASIITLAQLVSVLRTVVIRDKYTGIIQSMPAPESSTRLAVQLTKLVTGVGVFYRHKEVGKEEYASAIIVARDTIPERVNELVKQMWLHDCVGVSATAQDISEWTGMPVSTVVHLLNDLSLINVVKRDGTEFSLTMTTANMLHNSKIYEDERLWLRSKSDENPKAAS